MASTTKGSAAKCAAASVVFLCFPKHSSVLICMASAETVYLITTEGTAIAMRIATEGTADCHVYLRRRD